jgi:hypothetical protein
MQLTDLHLSRRRMVVALGGAVVVVGAVFAAPIKSLVEAGGRELANAVAGKRTVNLATAGYADWLAQVGTTFSTSGYNLKLAGIAPLISSGARPAGLRDRAFALNFDVAAGRTMAGELIYTINHPQYGPLQLFLSATGPQTPSRMLAVLN